MDAWTQEVTIDSTEMDLMNNTSIYATKMTNEINCTRRIQDLRVHQILGLASPHEPYWEARTTAYYAFFYILLAVFGLLFLALGCGCLLLLWKRHATQRFKVRTFIAIDLALMILGFSRVVYFCLDPWGQSGYFTCRGCVVFARLVAALGFPSLTASYTLVFITLWLSANMQIGRSWVQNLKILIPLCCVHYVIAITFEIIGSAATDTAPTAIALVACEVIFSIWGFLVCFMFLFAGLRLLKTVKKSARSSSIVCRDSPSMTRAELIKKSSFRHRGSGARQKSNLRLRTQLRDHHQRALRKVTIITYVTAGLGMLYSCLNIVQLVIKLFILYKGCLGFLGNKKMQPAVWLTIRYCSFSMEILLAVLLTYAISDYTPVVKLIKSCCGLKKVESEEEKVVSSLAECSEMSTKTNKSSFIRNGTSSPARMNGVNPILKRQLSTESEGTLNRSFSDVDKSPLEKKLKFDFAPSSPSPLTTTFELLENHA